AGLPVVIKVHGSDILLLGRYPRRRKRTVEALRGADAVVAVSRDLAERGVALGAEARRGRGVFGGLRPAPVPPGPAGEARARLGLNGGGAVLLSVGNLVPVKGPDVLIEACARLARQGLRFTCHLIGQGPLRRSLEQQVARLGLSERVRLLGALPQ